MSDTLAQQRRHYTETQLRKAGLEFDDLSPAWQQEFSTERYPLRDKDAVAERCLALLVIACKAEGLEPEIIQSLIETHKLTHVFSPQERAFLETPSPDSEQQARYLWYYESAWALLWALSYVDHIGEVNHYANSTQAVLCMHERSKQDFIRDATLRPHDTILDNLDRFYRYDLLILHYQQHGKTIDHLDEGIIFERYYALRWLCDPECQDWETLGQYLN